jgi:membrane protease YdiL (CAAX protease family)
MSDASHAAKMVAVRPIGGWTISAIGLSVLFQIIRLQQADPASWLFWDYAGRLVVLAVLAIDPAVRAVVYRRDRLRISLAIVINWGLLLIPILLAAYIAAGIFAAYLPVHPLSSYPRPDGWLRIFDLTFGLALVALHEEIVFRRCMRLTLGGLGDGRAMAAASAILFGFFHWWTGVPNVICAGVFGYVAMRIYSRSGALWPLVVIHYLADIWAFV